MTVTLAAYLAALRLRDFLERSNEKEVWMQLVLFSVVLK
jgi:hypothetical protein